MAPAVLLTRTIGLLARTSWVYGREPDLTTFMAAAGAMALAEYEAAWAEVEHKAPVPATPHHACAG